MTEAIELRDVGVRFGGVTALDGVSLTVRSGEVLGLIGPNGAGKSTLFDVVCGLVRPRGGTVSLFGRDVTHTGPYRRARLGLARTFQRLELFGMLTVRENVQVAGEIRRRWSGDRTRTDVDGLLQLVGIAELAERRSDTLATGPARLVEVARALAIRPRVLLLDEPASGCDADETARLVELLRRLAGDGLAAVLVDHNMHLVMGACHRVAVLDGGVLLTEGRPEDVSRDVRVRAAYLGLAGTSP